MRLYEYLKSIQRKLPYKNCVEYKEYTKFLTYFENFPIFSSFAYSNDDFIYIKAYALILSLINKDEIEEYTKKGYELSLHEYGRVEVEFIRAYVKNEIDKNELKYMTIEGNNYYVPIFGRAMNLIYSDEQDKLLSSPYDKLITNFKTSLIDCFEVYNFSLFDSSFTRLTPVKKVDNVYAFYHSDFKTLYFINDQGKLETKIAIFDKYMKKIVTTHILDRLTNVVDAYFTNDREQLYKALIDNNLISYKAINKLKRKENSVFNKLYR